MSVSSLRIGIYSGTFDPVHAGHLGFALYAQQQAHLDAVYFMPERQPRYKPQVTHFGHRIAMLKRAIAPYPSLGIIEFPDRMFSVKRIVPQLRGQFGKNHLVFLWGSDVFQHIESWPHSDVFMKSAEFIVSVRAEDDLRHVEDVAQKMRDNHVTVMVLDSLYPDVGSKHIREAIAEKRTVAGMLESSKHYATQEWLYVDIPKQAGEQ